MDYKIIENWVPSNPDFNPIEQGFPQHRFLIGDFECFFEGDLFGGFDDITD
jgi:hypothetical protein